MKRKLLWPALLSLVLVLAMCAFCPPAFADDEVRIEVTADPTELSEGGPVLFTFEISNYSDFELHEITIGLDNAIFTIEGMEGAVIPPGGSATFPLLYEVPDSKIGLELLFQVSWLRYGEPFTMEVPVTIARAVEPIITITRTVDSAYAKQGDTIILTYELANETKFDMTNITVIDEQISDNAILRNHTLNAGGTLSQSYVYTMGEDDVVSAPIVTYDVNGKTKSFSAIEPITLSMVLVQIDLNVEMGTPAATGVPFTITAVNNGNQTVTDIRITDELGNPVHEGSFSLDPGQSRSYSYLVVPVSTEPVRNVAFQLTGTDALGEAYEPEYEQTYEVHPFVDDSQLSVTLLPEILEPWTAQTGAVRVRVIIRNTSAVELINAVLSESTLGDLATYDVLNNGDTIFEQELVIGSPRNLTFSIKAVDPAGTERVLTGAMLTVAYPTATDTPAPTMPAAELPTEGIAGGWNSTLVIMLIIVGAVMLAAFTALIILAVLEHRRTGGIALDDELEDLDEPDESIDLAFDEDPVPPGPAPARTSSGQRTAEEFVRIAEERRQRFVPTKRPLMPTVVPEFDDGLTHRSEGTPPQTTARQPIVTPPPSQQAQQPAWTPPQTTARQPIVTPPPSQQAQQPAWTPPQTTARQPIVTPPPSQQAQQPAWTPPKQQPSTQATYRTSPPFTPPSARLTTPTSAGGDLLTPQEAAARAPKRISLRPEPAVRVKQRETVRRVPHGEEEQEHE